MFDFVKFFSVSVAGTPLLLVVMGLVTWISKTFKLQGQQSLICSMLVGLVLGGMYQ